MKIPVRIILLAILIIGMIPGVLADVTGANVSAYGGAMGFYSNESGNATLEVRTVIPLTVEDTAFPEWLFVLMAGIGFIFLISSLWFIARPNDVPSIAITMAGIITFGCYASCAMMAPYVARIDTFHDVLLTGISADVTVYATQVVTYTLSSWAAYACWGFAVAGGVVAIAGGLSWAGYLHKKGLKDASDGNYLESDIAGGGQDPNNLQYRRIGNGKPKK